MNDSHILAALVIVFFTVAVIYWWWQLPVPIQPKPLYCGSITNHGDLTPPLTQNATRHLQCFQNAFYHGQNATLDVFTMGVDIGFFENFTSLPRNSMQVIRINTTGTGINYLGPLPPNTIYCKSVTYAYNITVNANAFVFYSCTGGVTISIVNGT